MRRACGSSVEVRPSRDLQSQRCPSSLYAFLESVDFLQSTPHHVAVFPQNEVHTLRNQTAVRKSVRFYRMRRQKQLLCRLKPAVAVGDGDTRRTTCIITLFRAGIRELWFRITEMDRPVRYISCLLATMALAVSDLFHKRVYTLALIRFIF